MKHWKLALAVAGAIAVLSGCTSDAQTPQSSAAHAAVGTPSDAAATPPARNAAASGSTAGKAVVAKTETPSGLEAIAISDAAVKQIPGDKKGERYWEITATVRNGGSAALPGLELIADLRKEGEEHAFARNSAEVRFEAPLQPGATFAWRSLSPVLGKNPPASATVSVKATRWLEPKQADEGWKPLDPSTATPKTVGETISVPVVEAKPMSGKSTR